MAMETPISPRQDPLAPSADEPPVCTETLGPAVQTLGLSLGTSKNQVITTNAERICILYIDIYIYHTLYRMYVCI